MNRTKYLIESFNKIEEAPINETKEVLEIFLNENIRDQNHGDILVSSIEACMIAGQKGLRNEYQEIFNKTLNSKLGLEKDSKSYLEVQVLTTEDRKTAEHFAQTVQTATGGNILGGQLRTNIAYVIDKYFYNNSILADVTVMPYGEDTETVTDVTNIRVATATDELTGDVYEDNVSVVDTITPSIRISDSIEMSLKLREVMNPVNTATIIAKMLRTVSNQIESMIIGAVGSATNGTNQFYSILNNLAPISTNRGSITVTLPIAAGARPLNHIDAINLVAGQLPIYSAQDALKFTVCCNWATMNKLIRVADSTNQFYYNFETKTFTNLLTGGTARIVNNSSLPNDVVGIWDLSGVIVKLSRPFQIQSRISSLRDNRFEMVIDSYADATLSMAYKAIPLKNGFRDFTLKADYSL